MDECPMMRKEIQVDDNQKACLCDRSRNEIKKRNLLDLMAVECALLLTLAERLQMLVVCNFVAF